MLSNCLSSLMFVRGIGCCGLALAMLVLAGCSTPRSQVRMDQELERNTMLAQGAFASGQIEKAAGYYEKALSRARLADDPVAIARSAYNLATCLVILERETAVTFLLEEADTGFYRADIFAPELILLKARVARRQGSSDTAQVLLETAMTKMKGNPAMLVQAQILLADIYCEKGDAVRAREILSAVKPAHLLQAHPAVQAENDLVRGRVALLNNKARDAALAFDAAARRFQLTGRYPDMARALDAAGQAYVKDNDWDAALNRYYRAIRSLYLAGQTVEADALTTRALLLADQAGTAAMHSKIKRLQTEFKSGQ